MSAPSAILFVAESPLHCTSSPVDSSILTVKILMIDAMQRHDAGQTHERKLQEIKERNDTNFLPVLRDPC